MTGGDIKALRDRLMITQWQLAILCGVHAMTVSNWERGMLVPRGFQARILETLATLDDSDADGRVAEHVNEDNAISVLARLLFVATNK